MFLDRLSTVSSRITGALALSLIAGDGIPVESFSADPEIDIDALAAEMMAHLHGISADNRDLQVGDVQHLAVTTDRLTLMVSALSPGYYLLLVLNDPTSFGRARFELKRARLLFEGELD